MFDKLKSLFNATDDLAPAAKTADPVALAACVLMIEAAAIEDGIADDEWQTIMRLLQEHFSLSQPDAAALREQAHALHADSVQLLRFTRTLKDEVPHEERDMILELMWEIVLADDQLGPLEDTLIRRVAGLLYVSDRDRGAARKRVLARKQA
ncbi:MAG: TerB family tellurite resistance protein [Alphaproteobacteria bacterium]